MKNLFNSLVLLILSVGLHASDKPPALTAHLFSELSAEQLLAVVEMEEFVKTNDPNAYQKLIDQFIPVGECEGCESFLVVSFQEPGGLNPPTPRIHIMDAEEPHFIFPPIVEYFDEGTEGGNPIASFNANFSALDGECFGYLFGKPIGWVCEEEQSCNASFSITLDSSMTGTLSQTSWLVGGTAQTLLPDIDAESWIAQQPDPSIEGASIPGCGGVDSQEWELRDSSGNLVVTITFDYGCGTCAFTTEGN